MQDLLRITRTVLVVVIVLMLGINFYGYITYKIYGDVLPNILGNRLFVLENDYMLPNYKEGDLVIVRDVEQYYSDDPVVYGSYGNCDLRRIISVNGNNIELSYDSFDSVTTIYKYDIIGKVTSRIPFLGYIINLFKNYIFTAIIVIFTFILFMVEVKREKYKGLDYKLN